MTIEEKRALLQRAMNEGLEVDLEVGINNPYKVLGVGNHQVFITNCYGDEEAYSIVGYDWRIIEKPKMTLGYRKYIYLIGDKEVVDTCVDCAGCHKPAVVESSENFILWLDYEWQYEPVEGGNEL